MWALLPLWFLLLILIALLICLRCTWLVYILVSMPILITILFFAFRNYPIVDQNRVKFFTNLKLGGHRGSPTRAPENTIASFKQAKAEGCQLVEFDVHITADGVPVLMHDNTTGRTGETDVNVALATLATLKTVKLKDVNGLKGTIPTLEEAIEWCKKNGMKMLLDVKVDNDVLLRKIAQYFSEYRIFDSAIVSSFVPGVAFHLKRIDQRILTGLTLDRSFYSYADDYRRVPISTNIFGNWFNHVRDELTFLSSKTLVLPKFLGVEMLLINYKEVEERFIDEAREAGYEVVAYTVNPKTAISWISSIPVPFLTDVPFDVDQTRIADFIYRNK